MWILWRGDLAGLHLVDVSGLESESGKDKSVSRIICAIFISSLLFLTVLNSLVGMTTLNFEEKGN